MRNFVTKTHDGDFAKCKMAFLLSCDVGIYFDLTEPDVPAFEESYEAASTDIKKNVRFKI